ncbi:MAG: FAD-binding oxidoreductase [Chlamydiae bacterium]|nr:FAD-binding oxidoreductase [Chlamydiota bacterium]
MKTHVAVVGAGLAGLATTWHLLSLKPSGYQVTLFDEEAPGAGASGVASGLLHPFPASATRLSFKGYEALHHSLQLLYHVQGLSQEKLFDTSGILKLAQEDDQKREYSRLSRLYDRLQWWEADKVVTAAFLCKKMPALFLEQGVTVFCKPYLQALWLACRSLGARFEKQKVTSLHELQGFDKQVFCVGASIKKLDPSWKLQLVKGQLLTLKSQKPLTKLSLLARGYLAITQDPLLYHLGSTYEHNFQDAAPHKEEAVRLLKPQLLSYAREEAVQDLEIVGCEAALRVTNSTTYLPLIKRYSPTCYAFAALGSRGLLYHSFLGKQLAEALIYEDDKRILPEFFLRD